jgi:hypothetical protein
MQLSERKNGRISQQRLKLSEPCKEKERKGAAQNGQVVVEKEA